MLLACIILATLVLGFAYASLFEWTLHGFIMHKSLGPLTYPHRTHTYHHTLFTASRTYHLQPHMDKTKIAMAWWNGPVLIAIGIAPFCAAAVLPIAFAWYWTAGSIVLTGFFVSASYYGAYEYLHWCMHEPKNRFIERTFVFKWLDAHHRQHHRNWGKNLNVVFPLCDWLMGTLVRT